MKDFLIYKNPKEDYSVPITIGVKNVNNKNLTNKMLKKLLYNYGPMFVTINTKKLKFYPEWPLTDTKRRTSILIYNSRYSRFRKKCAGKNRSCCFVSRLWNNYRRRQ